MQANPVAIRRTRQETPRYELADEPNAGSFTLTEFLKVNAEGLSAEDIEAIQNLDPDEAYTGGGGAAAEWTIRRLRGRRDNPASDKPAPLHSFRNDDNMESYVHPSTQGGYNVTIRDVDSGEYLPTAYVGIPDEAQAIVRAKACVFGPGDARRANPVGAKPLHTLRMRAHRSVQLVRGENGTITAHFYATPAFEALSAEEKQNVLDEFRASIGVDALRLHTDGDVTWDDANTFGKHITMVVDNEEPDWAYDDGEVSTLSMRYTPGLEGPESSYRTRRREEQRALASAPAPKPARRRKNPTSGRFVVLHDSPHGWRPLGDAHAKFSDAVSAAENAATSYREKIVITDGHLGDDDNVVWRSGGTEGHHRRNPVTMKRPRSVRKTAASLLRTEQAITDEIQKLGARPVGDGVPWQDYDLETRAGTLRLHARGDILFGRFLDPDKAVAEGVPWVNPYSGKWNHGPLFPHPEDARDQVRRTLTMVSRRGNPVASGAPGYWSKLGDGQAVFTAKDANGAPWQVTAGDDGTWRFRTRPSEYEGDERTYYEGDVTQSLRGIETRAQAFKEAKIAARGALGSLFRALGIAPRAENPVTTSNEPLGYGPDIGEIEEMDLGAVSARAEHERIRENHRRYREGERLSVGERRELVEHGLIEASAAKAEGMTSHELAMHLPFVKQGEVEGPGGGLPWYVFIWSPLGKYIPQGEFTTEKDARADLKGWHEAHHEMVARMKAAERGAPEISVREVRMAAGGGGAAPALPPASPVRALPPAPPAPAAEAKEPTGGRHQSINRGWLMKQVEAGNVTMTGARSFDDGYGESRDENIEKKVSIRTEGDRSYPENEIKLHPHDFKSKAGTAYWTNKSKGLASLIVHPNLSYELRVANADAPAPAAKASADTDFPVLDNDPAMASYKSILAAKVPTKVVNEKERGKPLKEIAKDIRALFSSLKIKGVSVTAPTYSMASSVEIILPKIELTDAQAWDRGDETPMLAALRQRYNAVAGKIGEIVLAAFPDLDDRSDARSDYSDSRFHIH
jgi:hypothetical protein